MQYNLSYDIAAIFMLLTIIVLNGRHRRVILLQNRIFSALIVSILITSLTDLMVAYGSNHPGFISLHLQYVFTYVYFLTLTITCLLFAIYSLSLKDNRIIRNQAVMLQILCVPSIVVFTLLISNPFNQVIFSYDSNYIYYRGKGQALLYTANIFYSLFAVLYAFLNKRTITKRIRNAFLIFIFLAFFSCGIQLIYPSELIICFVLSLTLYVIFSNVQKPDSLLDPIVNIYNKNCFVRMFNVSLKNKDNTYAIIIQIEDIGLINQAIGIEKMNQILFDIGKFFSEDVRLQAYYLNSGCFVLMTQDKAALDERFVELKNRFEDKWFAGELSVNISIRTLRLSIPENVATVDTFYNHTTYLKRLDNSKNWHLDANDLQLDNSKRDVIIEQRIREAIENEDFQVYYQPIIDSKTDKVISAEALIRLYTDDLGFIPPMDFIPMAERKGMILDIGEQVLKKVFDFMSKNDLVSKGLEFIEINLSVVQCMQEDMADKLLNLLNEYNIESSRVNLEITETAAANSPRMLLQNMNELSSNDIHFSLDDFGTGYSNINSIIDLPFNIIKFDKYMIDMATKSDKGKLILASNVAMMKNMNMKIVAEGIETIEQVEAMKLLGIDYLQGFYYSRPIPPAEFIHFLNKHNGIDRISTK